ncbi:hypothetical protein [Cohnella soli]|uniref:Beta-galactosidase trimerisation domain-containing protein n=1 Tax=Cohnella soli TaxID=425005 RepID=A0ABW0HKE0_9BACL
MKLHYSLDSAIVLDADHGPLTLDMLKEAGVNTIWLYGFFFGKLWSPIEEMVKAADLLRVHGFEVGVIQLPVGHPGNGLNPDDDSLDLRLPAHWSYRLDHEGLPVYYCAAIEDAMIEDNVRSVRELKAAGFTQFFIDDDLRSGLWGERMSGCFSDRAIAGFNAAYARNVDRAALVRARDDASDQTLVKEWIAYQCEQLTGFMASMADKDVRVGLMVMHLGDERQGIDIAAVKKRIPDCLFRVGEFHFDDRTFGTAEGKASEWFSMIYHLDAMGREYAFSETTVFPAKALSPDNLIFKARLALIAGIPNLLLMSGTWLITEEYWRLLASELPELKALEERCARSERDSPIHVAYGTSWHAEAIQPYTLPILAGLPVRPVRAGFEDGPDSGDAPEFEGADCLLFVGDYEVTPEWERRFVHYGTVLMDQTAYRRNRQKLEALGGSNVEVLDYAAGELPAAVEIERLRSKLLAGGPVAYPMLTTGSNILLIWHREAARVLLVNLAEQPTAGTLVYKGKECEIQMKPLEIMDLSLKQI